MSEDDEAFVRARWPDLWVQCFGSRVQIIGKRRENNWPTLYKLGMGNDEPAAWANAAKRIREQADEHG